MGYNNINTFYIEDSEPLTINDKDVVLLFRELKDSLPEFNFLESLYEDIELFEGAADVHVAIPNFAWYGTRSGAEFETLREKIVPKLGGSAGICVVGEDGRIFGWSIKDGVLKECEVKMVLV